MDIRDPALILSTVDLLAIVGSTYYFYKRNEELELKITGQQKAISALTLKMANYEKAQQHRNDGLTILNDRIKELGETMQQLPSTEHLENINEDVEEIVMALQDGGIEIELPSQINRAKASRRSVRSDVDDNRGSAYNRRTGSRPTRDTDVKPRSRAPIKAEQPRTQSNEQPQNTRSQPRGQPNEQPQNTRPQLSRNYEDDDAGLIADLRSQQEQY